MKNQLNIALAGATGYLGTYIAKELIATEMNPKLIVRNPDKIQLNGGSQNGGFQNNGFQLAKAAVTKKEDLKGIFNGIDVVISAVGITRQKDGLTYMDVDYQANKNLLDEAKKAGVQKFIYVSAINGEHFRNLKIFEAKEKFVDALKASGLDYTVLRPNGFFSDMKDFLQMAKSGRVYLFGDGNYKLNPIHGSDLAKVVVGAIYGQQKEIVVGGPDILTQNEIAKLALDAYGKAPKITHLPDWIRKGIVGLMRTFTSSKTYGPVEFFMTMMAQDNIAPREGINRLESFFRREVDSIQY